MFPISACSTSQPYFSCFSKIPVLNIRLFTHFFTTYTYREKSSIQTISALSQEELNAQWNSHENQVVNFALNPQANTMAIDHLRNVCCKLNPTNLEKCLSAISQKIIENPSQISVEVILKMIDRMRVDAKVQKQVNAIPFQTKSHDRFRIFWRFIPNLIDTFLKALNILEVGKRPESIWDYSALIAIYMTVLSLPSFLLQHVFHFVSTPVYTYGLTAALTAAVPLAICAYLKWLRPHPRTSPNTTNVAETTTTLFADRKEELDQINQLVQGGFSVLIKGDQGVGKSALVRELSKRLPDKIMLQVKDGVFKTMFANPVEKLEIDCNEIENYPGKYILYIDECGRIADDPNLVDFFKDKLEQKKLQVIGTVSTHDFDQKLKGKTELLDRFIVRTLNPPKETDLKLIFWEYYHHLQGSIDCSNPKEFIAHFVKVTTEHIDKIKCGKQPRAAMRIWNLAVQSIQQFSIDQWESADTTAVKKELEEKKWEIRYGSPKGDYRLPSVDKLVEVDAQERKKMHCLADLIRIKQKIQRLWVDQVDLNEQAKGIVHVLMEKLEAIVCAMEKQLPTGVNLRLNTAMIDKIIAELG